MTKEEIERACQDISGGRRCGVTASNGLNSGDDPDGWWVGYSPRNGLYASVEGPWEDWVNLARNIIAEDERHKSTALGKNEVQK